MTLALTMARAADAAIWKGSPELCKSLENPSLLRAGSLRSRKTDALRHRRWTRGLEALEERLYGPVSLVEIPWRDLGLLNRREALRGKRENSLYCGRRVKERMGPLSLWRV